MQCRGVEQRQLVGLITQRSQVRVLPPLPGKRNARQMMAGVFFMEGGIMASAKDGLKSAYREIGGWRVPTFELAGAERSPLSLPITGYIANSVPTSQTGKDRLRNWKILVASEVKRLRGRKAWNPGDEFAISVGFRFNGRNHGNRKDERGRVKLDVENFLKPVVDAIAAGLFCEQGTCISQIDHWNYDDSNFNTLLVHRLPDAEEPEGEGIAVYVSSSSRG